MFDELIKEEKITQIEIDVLAFLHNNPEYKCAQDIVDIRGISKAHASLAIEKLVQKGYLVRKPCENNRRKNTLIITEKANDIVSKISKIQEKYSEIYFKDISHKEKEEFNTILRRMYKNIGGKIDE
jgi:MarR family transcriptional regulator for hemolysin